MIIDYDNLGGCIGYVIINILNYLAKYLMADHCNKYDNLKSMLNHLYKMFILPLIKIK